MVKPHENVASLPSLRKLTTLRVIGHTPVPDRFNQDLVDHWMPMVQQLSVKYDMRGRIDDADLKQELIQQIWRLTLRIDPVSQPDDFRRMCRTELRNKCVDLSRWIRAQKRMGRTGKGVLCKTCGVVSHHNIGGPGYCKYCGPGSPVISVDMLARETNIESAHKETPETFASYRRNECEDGMLISEMIDQIAHYLEANNMQASSKLLALLVNPTDDLFSLMDEKNITCDHRTMILSVYAEYFRTTERDISNRMRYIREAVAHVCGDELSSSFLSKMSPRSK